MFHVQVATDVFTRQTMCVDEVTIAVFSIYADKWYS